MKSPVILIAIAMNIIVSLLLFLQSVPSPMDQHYQDCLKQISLQTGIKQEVSLLQYYPDLKIAKTNCETVKLLRTEIENMRGGPAPLLSKEEIQIVKQKEAKIEELQKQNDLILKSIEGAIVKLP